MIYWYTGQPGHGKTLHAIEKLLEFKAKGRAVYACNIRAFDYDKAGVLPMTPEQFNAWMTFLPDGAVALVDEAYEHGMLPKRAPGAKVPEHVEQLAKHRHRGIDFIFVCQSPDKQVDVFVHDLIERHTHVRRRFGTSFVHLREFDKFERNPEKGHPLVIRRGKLPKKIFGLYQSTELETTERRIPWYFWAFGLGAPAALALMWYTFGGIGQRLGKDDPAPIAASASRATEPSGDGAKPAAKPMSMHEYLAQFTPLFPSQPWSAPVYAHLKVPSEPPRVFCMASGPGEDASGKHAGSGCKCLTEQGTTYQMSDQLCREVAVNGQYEPYYDEKSSRLGDGLTQQEQQMANLGRLRGDGDSSPSAMPQSGAVSSGGTQPFGTAASYGQIGLTESSP